MSAPLVAGYRIEFSYTVRGILHKLRHYCKVVAGSGPSGYDLVLQDGTVGIDSRAGAARMWVRLAGLYNSGDTTFNGHTLQKLVSGAWQPLDIASTTTVATSSTGFGFAAQGTIFLRDTLFHPVKSIILEHVIPVGQRITSFTASNAINDYVNDFTTYSVSSGIPTLGNWVVSRSNAYVASKLAATFDLNDKVRRRRGIA